MAPLRRQHLIKRCDRVALKGRQGATAEHQRIGGQDSWTAGVGDDREPWPLGAKRLLAEHIRKLEQIGELVDPKHAATAKCGIEDLIAARQGTGVG